MNEGEEPEQQGTDVNDGGKVEQSGCLHSFTDNIELSILAIERELWAPS